MAARNYSGDRPFVWPGRRWRRIRVRDGLVFAMVASLFFGLAYWFCRSRVRIQRVLRYRRSLLSVATIATAVLVIWYTLPLFESQQYSVRVKNWSSSELLAVEIRVAGITTPIGRIQPGATIFQEGLTNRPTGAVTVRWVDDQGVNYAVTERSIGGPPRRYNGGELRINVQSQSDIDTYFLMNP